MYRTTQSNRVRVILGGQGKNDGKLNLFLLYYDFRDYCLSLGLSYLI